MTGSSDGLIRVCSILPNKLLGVLGAHDDFPVEAMKVGRTSASTGFRDLSPSCFGCFTL